MGIVSTIGRRSRWAPPAGASLDWNHPLAANLEFAVVPASAGTVPGVADATGKTTVTRNGNMSVSASPTGSALTIGSVNAYLYLGTLSANRPLLAGGPVWTVVGNFAAPPGLVGEVVGYYERDFGAQDIAKINLRVSNDSQSRIQYRTPGGVITSCSADWATPICDSRFHQLAVWKNGTTVGMARDGGELPVSMPTTLTAGDVLTSTSMSRRVVESAPVTVAFEYSYGWSRQLSLAEIAALYADPYCMLRG